ncbi:AAA family ATPase [Stigmatella sp. ncwal1]|uniref:AAA family ATPase n=1 Tax=Stigmatella ashevillensis TaxID=2995309 RepID=A0ABT5DDI4_9BACT|nr:AAA family ATPase [Stigmatella ashevillena]MDC0711747.1 AAA family ATPase [Stigmatella ashevillena]
MSNAKLLAVNLERFKSFKEPTRVDFSPLTIILGRNNSGKSTLIQSLLLLKQTLADPRPDVTLKLEGLIDAFSLRELTFGWPAEAVTVEGPEITVEWESTADVQTALEQLSWPDFPNLAKHSGVTWLKEPLQWKVLRTAMTLRMAELEGETHIAEIRLRSLDETAPTEVRITHTEKRWSCQWNGHSADKIGVELDHFIPYLRIDRSDVGPRDRQRAWHNAYMILFAQPLEALKKLLSELHYLGSSRQPPPSMFKAATTAPNEIGVSGELAAQLLHRRQRDIVHFLPPLQLSEGSPVLPETVLARPLVDAVNAVMSALTVTVPVRVEVIREIGFRLMFGEASLAHVGRGLGYLLPIVELGLFADPIRFSGSTDDMTLDTYNEQCGAFTHIALEEPEAHLHPKVASRLAHWLVSLALANRRLIVETHSDHLVRRLRGLAARAGRNSPLETWLLENVVVLTVEQNEEGRSMVTTSRLTAEGGVAESWPADFMDEATDEESAIYYAKLDKAEAATHAAGPVEFDETPEPETDEAP